MSAVVFFYFIFLFLHFALTGKVSLLDVFGLNCKQKWQMGTTGANDGQISSQLTANERVFRSIVFPAVSIARFFYCHVGFPPAVPQCT